MESTMPSPARQLLVHAYACFNSRDIASALADMHPDVEWSNAIDGGMAHGHNAVRDYWTRQWTSVDPHVDPLRIDDDEDGHLVVAVHQVVRDLSGLVVAERFVEHAYLFEDGLIKRMEIRSTEPRADRFTSQ